MSKKILLIPDVPNWALDKEARNIIKYNRADLEFDIVYFPEFIRNWEKFYNEYDLLYPIYNILFYEFIIRNIPVDKVITGIRSYNSWDRGRTVPPGYNIKPPRRDIRLLKKALLVNTHCKKLWYIFSKYIPIIHLKYPTDLEMFYPEERKKKNDKLLVGWAGSLVNHGPRIRGVDEFIKPACEAVDGVELKMQIGEENRITDDNEMREFYNSLDLYICASSSEGTPCPLIEAAACGVPPLTTDVGVVPELVEDNVNGMVVERTVEAFIDKLKYCVKNRDMLPEMGKRAREKMEREFNWNNVIYQWIDFFKFALDLHKLKNEGIIK